MTRHELFGVRKSAQFTFICYECSIIHKWRVSNSRRMIRKKILTPHHHVSQCQSVQSIRVKLDQQTTFNLPGNITMAANTTLLSIQSLWSLNTISNKRKHITLSQTLVLVSSDLIKFQSFRSTKGFVEFQKRRCTRTSQSRIKGSEDTNTQSTKTEKSMTRNTLISVARENEEQRKSSSCSSHVLSVTNNKASWLIIETATLSDFTSSVQKSLSTPHFVLGFNSKHDSAVRVCHIIISRT